MRDINEILTAFAQLINDLERHCLRTEPAGERLKELTGEPMPEDETVTARKKLKELVAELESALISLGYVAEIRRRSKQFYSAFVGERLTDIFYLTQYLVIKVWDAWMREQPGFRAPGRLSDPNPSPERLAQWSEVLRDSVKDLEPFRDGWHYSRHLGYPCSDLTLDTNTIFADVKAVLGSTYCKLLLIGTLPKFITRLERLVMFTRAYCTQRVKNRDQRLKQIAPPACLTAHLYLTLFEGLLQTCSPESVHSRKPSTVRHQGNRPSLYIREATTRSDSRQHEPVTNRLT